MVKESKKICVHAYKYFACRLVIILRKFYARLIRGEKNVRIWKYASFVTTGKQDTVEENK